MKTFQFIELKGQMPLFLKKLPIQLLKNFDTGLLWHIIFSLIYLILKPHFFEEDGKKSNQEKDMDQETKNGTLDIL